jgi:hypothetical protein
VRAYLLENVVLLIGRQALEGIAKTLQVKLDISIF